MEEHPTTIDVIMEATLCLIRESDQGKISKRVQVSEIGGAYHEQLETLAREGRLDNWVFSVLCVHIYPTSVEEIKIFEMLKKRFSRGMKVEYSNNTLTLDYDTNSYQSEVY
ncbi:hypothetical protein HY483_02870 [Candidatus Woesearchaeota archaeon]|nr:hypothetical protein [Candidatus Woesearchaeota archaeon]